MEDREVNQKRKILKSKENAAERAQMRNINHNSQLIEGKDSTARRVRFIEAHVTLIAHSAIAVFKVLTITVRL